MIPVQSLSRSNVCPDFVVGVNLPLEIFLLDNVLTNIGFLFPISVQDPFN